MMKRKILGWLVAQAYWLTGLRRRAIAKARQPGMILPIVFHAAAPNEVRAILLWLKVHELLEHVELTFDDGWREFKSMLPVLEEFGKSATLFIAPGETRRGRIWTDGLSLADRKRLYGASEAERCFVGKASETPALLTEAEVREVARHPLVRLGNHTWSHVSCVHRPVDEVLSEIRRAQDTLTEWGGCAPTEFAYPFGRGTPELDAAIRALGLRPHYTRQGLTTEATRGAARNMVYEGMTIAENIGRILMAWPKVGVTL